MRIANSGVLMRCWPRSPWYQARTRTIGRPIRSARSAICRSCCGPVEGLADVLEALQESPGSGDVDESPLDDLAAAQPGPGALGFTLCRRVGHSAAPMARSVAASDTVATVKRRVRQARALFTARRGGCLAVSIGCLDEFSGSVRSPHQRGATPQRRSPGESASRRAGNLETWDPAARSRTPQVVRIPAFQFLAPAATSAGATGERAGAGGNLANWKPGTLGSARRGGGRVDRARRCRSARVGRARAAVMGSPHGATARVPPRSGARPSARNCRKWSHASATPEVAAMSVRRWQR